MRYIKDNLIFETPIFAEKDGEEVELFDEQLRRLGYVPEEEVIMKQRAEIANKSYATVDKLQILLNSIEVQAPQGSTHEDDVRTKVGTCCKWKYYIISISTRSRCAWY